MQNQWTYRNPAKEIIGHCRDLTSNALPLGGLWYGEPNPMKNAIDYAKHRSGSHDAVIRVFGARLRIH